MNRRLNLIPGDLRPSDLAGYEGLDASATAALVRDAVRAGVIPPDRAFDCLFPRDLRLLSTQHWTPIVVAARAARWLRELGVRTVVDIGSGAGKFCVVAALAGDCQFTGLEQRPRLVAAAEDLSRLLGVHDRVSFVVGTLAEGPLPVAEAYYLYNPFGENLFGSEDHIDDDVELGDVRYERDVAAADALLAAAPIGTFLLTYNGFGGTVPKSYREVRVDRELPNVLRMWEKTSSMERSPRRSEG